MGGAGVNRHCLDRADEAESSRPRDHRDSKTVVEKLTSSEQRQTTPNCDTRTLTYITNANALHGKACCVFLDTNRKVPHRSLSSQQQQVDLALELLKILIVTVTCKTMIVLSCQLQYILRCKLQHPQYFFPCTQ